MTQQNVPQKPDWTIIQKVAQFSKEAAGSTAVFDEKIKAHFGEGADTVSKLRVTQNHRDALSIKL
jgi:hypothetical protein